MFVLIVYVHVKPEYVEAFRESVIENGRNSRQEAGIVRFDIVQETEDPTRFALIEVYRSREGHAEHRETSHFKAWAALMTDMLVEPRTRTWYQTVDPPDAEW
jgi:(4S)-4-hydroxy-5-phosphonooxypentane-2,3-dione isomerase